MRSVNFLDTIIIAAYFVFMLAIGVYFMRKTKNAREYFAGGNLIPWWISGMTMYMANFSAWTFTGAAGFAYHTGWFALVYFSLSAFAYWIGSSLSAVRWRRTRSITPVEYTHTRFNVTTQQLMSWVISSNFILSAGVQLASTCKLLAPVIGVDILMLTIITGVVILLYTFAGGLWAVSITDVVQGVILLGITMLVMPLSLGLIGGFGTLVEKLPALAFDHTYNGFHYTEHWLVSIFFIMTIGVAAGQAQRFYSVKDERDAKRVGRFAGALFLSMPFIFGIPPLVARVFWPDLSVIEFFRPYAGKNPQDLVFIGLCMKLLPNGLIGLFIAAMLAATMSTLSAVYNMISSIIARDIYQGMFRPQLSDSDLLSAGKKTSVVLGLVVIGLAILFSQSSLGIFNIMQIFYTLLNIPIVVPLLLGLLFQKPSKWSAVASVVFGLVIGVITRYGLGWDIGPQVYAQLATTAALVLASGSLGRLYLRRRALLMVMSFSVTIGFIALFLTTGYGAGHLLTLFSCAGAVLLGGGLIWASKLFSRESVSDRESVALFFQRLQTPIDVEAEVHSRGAAPVQAYALVGWTTIAIGLLVTGIQFTTLSATEHIVVAALTFVMIVFGAMLVVFGKRSVARKTDRQA